MKNRTLTLMAACLMGLSAFAQWSEPALPTDYATSLTLGNKYLVKNADSDQFIGAGTGYNVWDTAVTMVNQLDDEGNLQAIIYTIDDTEDDYGSGITFVNSATDLYTFISGAATTDHYGWGEMHVDMASQGYNHFEVEDNGNGTFRIKSPEYPEVIDGETIVYSGYWGWVKDDVDYPQAVWALLDPSVSGNSCNWQFIDMTIYYARVDLYDALVESTNYSAMDQSVVASATDVYNNSTNVEEIEAATKAVKEARNEAIVQGATTSSPTDATLLIENPDFETGNIEGWYCSFEQYVNAQNIGFQSGGTNDYTNYTYTYINHEGVETNPFCKNFIEAWTYTTYTDDAPASACIGDGELSQTIKEMPAGNWKLSADVIAVQQYDASVTEQYGVQLFATSGDYDMSIDISTGNGVPEHVELWFSSSGDDLTLGLRTQSTNCNWICADNFELTCYGDEDSAYKFILQQTISDCEAEFPYTDEVKADAQVIAAYEDALSEAQSVLNSSNSDAELEAASDALTAAADALRTSVAEYAAVAEYIDYINTVCNLAHENDWGELEDELADYRDGLAAGYEDGELTSEQVAEMEDIVSTMIADYISENCKAGDDVSILIRNNDFDTDNSGWDVVVIDATNGNGGAWGPVGQNENTIEGAPTLAEINSGCYEYYLTSFSISQTIKNMPEGLYTLSCQAFERDDNGAGVEAEMFATMEGSDQSQKVMNILDDGSEEQLYGCGEWYDDSSVTLSNGDSGYTPNGMAGALVYFYADHYKNTFNILVTQRGDLTIGVRTESAGDWVLFDTFRLVYQGNNASVYADYIQELIDQAIAIGDNVIVDKADQMLLDAIEEGEEAMDGNDADACIAAIQSLQDAIAYAEESITLVEDLDYFYNYTVEIRMPEVDLTTDSSFDELVEEIDAALNGDGFESNDQVEGYMTSLKTGFTTYVMAPYIDGTIDATEDDPADITPVIMTSESTDNEGEGSTYGWDIASGTTVGLGYGCAEIYNQDIGAGMSQVLYNLAAGYYRLGVQAFYRPGNGFSTNLPDTMDVAVDDTIHYADIYAGDKATRVRSILSDAEAYDAIYNNGGTGLTVPNTMEEANNAFEYELYGNTLQFQVAEDGTDVTIGIVKTQYISGDWLIWDNWTLFYIGTTEPTEDATTAIEGIEGASSVETSAIYSVNGVRQSRLTKGINIVKTTMADGTVNVTKVLVK